MSSNLQLITSREFNGDTLDCYIEPEQEDKGAFWATREQIGRLLGYADPTDAIKKIHKRNKKRLDKFSMVVLMNTLSKGGDKMSLPLGNIQRVTVYNFMGLLEICRYSQQPKANEVIDKLWEIAEEIRRTGSYSVKMTAEDRELKLRELEVRERELEFKDRELELQAAQVLNDILHNPPFSLTDETRTVFGHEVFRLATNKEYLAMLPESTERWYTATEIGSILGISANRVGRVAKTLGIKAPEGKSNEYGRWIFSKSKNSNREVPSYIYSEAGLELFKDYQNGELLEIGG